jgi:hypothetical protein
MLEGHLIPRFAPAVEEEPIVGPSEAARGDVGHDRVRLEVHLVSVLPHEEAEVAVLADATQFLVELPELLERLQTYEHAVELHLLARHPQEMMTHLGRPFAREAMPVDEAMAASPLFDLRIPGGHVNLFPLGLADEVHRTDAQALVVSAHSRSLPSQPGDGTTSLSMKTT